MAEQSTSMEIEEEIKAVVQGNVAKAENINDSSDPLDFQDNVHDEQKKPDVSLMNIIDNYACNDNMEIEIGCLDPSSFDSPPLATERTDSLGVTEQRVTKDGNKAFSLHIAHENNEQKKPDGNSENGNSCNSNNSTNSTAEDIFITEVEKMDRNNGKKENLSDKGNFCHENKPDNNSKNSNGNNMIDLEPNPGSNNSFTFTCSPPICAETTLNEIFEYLEDIEVKVEGSTKKEDDDYDFPQDDIKQNETTSTWNLDHQDYMCHMEKWLELVSAQIEKEGHDDKEEVAEILRSVKEELNSFHEEHQHDSGIDDGMILMHIQAIMSQVYKLLCDLRPVNLDKLLRLITPSHNVGDSIDGKDIHLFIGSTGSGKTTTIHFLSGSSFVEKVVHGFDHLEVVDIKYPCLSRFKTSFDTRSVTRTMQSVEVEVENGRKIILCDSPGFNDTNGVEVDIANGLGIFHALCRAKTVKPVLVLSKDGLGSRLTSIPEIFSTVIKLIGGNKAGSGDSLNTASFAYVFTKYLPQDKDRLHHQFRLKRKRPTEAEKSNPAFVLFLDDIIAKSTPSAHIISPTDNKDHNEILSALMQGQRIENPKATFSPFVSETSRCKLELQLRMTSYQLEKALKSRDTTMALYRLKQLTALGKVLPEAKEFAKNGINEIKAHFALHHDSFCKSIEKCLKFFRNKELFTHELQAARSELEIILSLKPLHTLCINYNGEVDRNFCHTSIVRDLAMRLSQDTNSLHCQDYGDLTIQIMSKKEYIIEKLNCVKVLAKTFDGFSMQDCNLCTIYQQDCDILVKILVNVIEQAEQTVAISSIPPIEDLFSKNDLLCFMIRYLEKNHNQMIDLSDLKSRQLLVHEKLEKNIRSTISSAISMLSTKPSSSALFSDMLGIDQKTIHGSWNLLTNIQHNNPEMINMFPSLTFSEAEKMAQNLEASILEYLYCLVLYSQKSFDAVKETGSGANIEELIHNLSKTNDSLLFFRALSVNISNKSEQDYRRFIKINYSLEAFLEKLESGPDIARGEDAIIHAKKLLQQIEAGHTISVLSDIVQAWTEWEEIIKIPKRAKPGVFRKLAATLGFSSGNDSSNTAITSTDFIPKLVELRCQIGHKVRAHLSSFTDQIKIDHRDSYTSTDLFMKLTNEAIFLIEFMKLERDGSPLAKWVLKAPKINETYHMAQKSLMIYSEALTSEFHDLLKQHKLTQLNKFLTAVCNADNFLSQIKSFANGRWSKKWHLQQQKFRENIFNCQDYRTQVDELNQFLMKLEYNTCNVIFLHEARVNSRNEHDRNLFYQNVASSYAAVFDAQCLVDHVNMCRVDVRTMWKNALKQIEHETRRIGDYVVELLEHFPEVEQDYKKLYIWYGNLISIEKNFKTVASQAAALSVSLRDKADRSMQLRLKEISSKKDKIKSPEDLVLLLITLKKASMQVICWRGSINALIDELLQDVSNNSSNCGRYILNVGLELKKVEGDDASIAQMLLSDHECFEGAMNAVFNIATARQGIDYVTEGIGATKSMQAVLKCMYKNFREEYQSIITEGLVNLGCHDEKITKEFFCDLVKTATEIAEDYSIDYRTQLTDLTAHIFAYWTLKNTNTFFLASMHNDLGDSDIDSQEYLMQPHAVQVVAIWMLLNHQHDEYRRLESHLVQILTGEGKSIVLGITAIILAMMQCEVECICYSSYLSGRDFDAFKDMFRDFDVLKFINYGTVNSLCNRMLDKGGDLRSLTAKIVLGKENENVLDTSTEIDSNRMKVLLIDEVDVLFKDDFYGSTYRPLSTIAHSSIIELMEFIWENREILDEESLLQPQKVMKCRRLFSKELHPLVSNQMREMVNDAKQVKYHKYRVSQGKIGYKEFDGLTFSTHDGYKTCFAAMQEYKRGSLNRNQVLNYQKLGLCCGSFSYAEIPSVFDLILGVTGTLKGLSGEELQILSDYYDIEKKTFMPSVYGSNKLNFSGDNPRDVILCHGKSEHFMEIRNEINARRKPEKKGVNRAVMVFFDSCQTLLEFYESEHMGSLKSIACTITEEIGTSDKEGAFLQATLSGAVTLMIRDFGRGTDFKCFDSQMLDSGGVHVIQAFFSFDNSEEIQIKGRTARQGNKGSFSMVLNTDSLKSELSITDEEIENMRNTSRMHSFLAEKRAVAYANKCINREKKVKKAEDLHYQTMNYKENLLRGRRNLVVSFLYQMNGHLSLNSSSASSSSSNCLSKKKFLDKKKQRYAEHIAFERLQRESAQKSFREQMLLLKNEESENYYSLLGVEPTASNKEIQQAFRMMSRKYHPDKCKKFGTEEQFKHLIEAKEVLLCPKKRAEYDKKLKGIK